MKMLLNIILSLILCGCAQEKMMSKEEVASWFVQHKEKLFLFCEVLHKHPEIHHITIRDSGVMASNRKNFTVETEKASDYLNREALPLGLVFIASGKGIKSFTLSSSGYVFSGGKSVSIVYITETQTIESLSAWGYNMKCTGLVGQRILLLL